MKFVDMDKYSLTGLTNLYGLILQLNIFWIDLYGVLVEDVLLRVCLDSSLPEPYGL